MARLTLMIVMIYNVQCQSFKFVLHSIIIQGLKSCRPRALAGIPKKEEKSEPGPGQFRLHEPVQLITVTLNIVDAYSGCYWTLQGGEELQARRLVRSAARARDAKACGAEPRSAAEKET